VRNKLLTIILADLKKRKLYKIAEDIRIPYATFHRIVMKKGNATMATWEKIDKYYKNKEFNGK